MTAKLNIYFLADSASIKINICLYSIHRSGYILVHFFFTVDITLYNALRPIEIDGYRVRRTAYADMCGR